MKCPECNAELIECVGSDGEDTFDGVKCPEGCNLRDYYGGFR